MFVCMNQPLWRFKCRWQPNMKLLTITLRTVTMKSMTPKMTMMMIRQIKQQKSREAIKITATNALYIMCKCVNVVNEAIIKAIDKFTITIQFTSRLHKHIYTHILIQASIFIHTLSRALPSPRGSTFVTDWEKKEIISFYFHNKHCSDACFCCNKQLLKIKMNAWMSWWAGGKAKS